jgi:hypothetical protein
MQCAVEDKGSIRVRGVVMCFGVPARREERAEKRHTLPRPAQLLPLTTEKMAGKCRTAANAGDVAA